MKYYATKFSISNLIFFLVISFFGLTANARPVCTEIKIQTTGGCGSVNMCSSGKEETQKVCYEVPDVPPGPIPDGPGPGSGEGGSGGDGSLEELAKQETEAKKKEQQEKYCKLQPSEIDLKQEKCILDAIRVTNEASNKCSNFTWGLSWIAGFNYSPSCRSYWAGYQAEEVQRCNVVAAEADVALAKECP